MARISTMPDRPRDFQREERLHEVGVRPAGGELRTLVDSLMSSRSARTAPLTQVLAPDLLAGRHDRLRTAVENTSALPRSTC